MEVSVSILKSNNPNDVTLKLVEETTASSIHIDLMDGDYVLEKNDDLGEVVNLFQNCRKPLEIHLMMRKNLSYAIDYLAILKPRVIFIPLDIPNLHEYIRQIKDYNIKVGLAIHPDTSISDIKDYLSDISLVLLMTVYPGRGGQKFLESSVERLKSLRDLVGSNMLVGVDGGINVETVDKVRGYVDFVISGSYICMAQDYQVQIDNLL